MNVDFVPPLHAGLLRLDDLESFRRRPYYVYLASPMTNLPKRRERLTVNIRNVIRDTLLGFRGCLFDIYDPSYYTPPTSAHSPNRVYSLDRFQVASSDALIVCATSPADGMGREAEFALANRIPTLLVHPDKARVSKLMRAQPLQLQLDPIVFQRIADLRSMLEVMLPQFSKLVIEQSAQRRVLLDEGTPRRTREVIIGMRLLNGMTRRELAEKVHLDYDLICDVERHDVIAAGLSQMNFLAILHALDCHYTFRIDGHASSAFGDTRAGRQVDSRLRPAWSQSFLDLVEYVTDKCPANDDCVLGMWGHYHEMMTQALAGREDLSNPVSFDQWHTRYRDMLDRKPLFDRE